MVGPQGVPPCVHQAHLSIHQEHPLELPPEGFQGVHLVNGGVRLANAGRHLPKDLS